MQLMTKQIEKKAAKYPIYSQDEKGLDAEIILVLKMSLALFH